MLERIEPESREFSVLGLDDNTPRDGLTYTLEQQFVRANEQAAADYRNSVAPDMAWLDRVSRELIALIRRRAQDLTGLPWEQVVVSESEAGTQIHERRISGKLDRFRWGKRIAWVYRSEVEPDLTEDMQALIAGYWQRWNGRQAISTELVERIVARRTYAIIG